MAELDDFLTAMNREAVLSDDERRRLSALWPDAERAAGDCLSRMTSIGFFSFARRARAFVAICHDLDIEVTSGHLDQEQAQLALTILRMRSRPYRKAEAMFAARSGRLSPEDEAKLPETAREFLSSVRHLSSARR